MADAAQDFLDSGGSTDHPMAANDPNVAPPVSADPGQAFLESGGKAGHPLAKEDAKAPSLWERYKGFQESQLAGLTGGVASLGGGLTYLGTLAATGGNTDAAKAVKDDTERTLTYRPRTEEGQRQSADMSDAAGYLGSKEGAYLGDKTMDATASPGLATAANVAANIPQFILGAKAEKPYSLEDVTSGASPKTGSVVATAAPPASSLSPRATPKLLPAPEVPELTTSSSERSPYFDVSDDQAAQQLGIKPERQEDPKAIESTGGLSTVQQQARKDLAQRLGLSEVRKSAIEGNAQDAADDFDSTKYTADPTGERMRGVIGAEQKALTQHAEGIVEDAGGSPGTDQSSNIATGRTIAQPFDDLRDFINDQKKQMYAAGRERLGASPIDTTNIEAALNDPELKNRLMAQGKESLLKGAQAQLDQFKANNGGTINVATAERYRQFVNTLWGTDKHAVGKLTEAIDNDVGAAVGEDVFAPARALHGLGKDLLENPDGVSDLFDKDPRKGSVNRSTDFEDIPDKLANLSGAQFKNVFDTLNGMPEELQPQAAAAKEAIQAHMANRLLDAGTKTSGQWNKKGVNSELRNNSGNYSVAFADRPDLAAKIKDLKDGGEMLRFNAAYRGAHAQASNMIRQGVGAGAEWVGGGVGGALGTFLGGPGMPTAAGALAGRAAISRGLTSLKNRSLRKDVESRIVKLDGE